MFSLVHERPTLLVLRGCVWVSRLVWSARLSGMWCRTRILRLAWLLLLLEAATGLYDTHADFTLDVNDVDVSCPPSDVSRPAPYYTKQADDKSKK